MNTRLFRGFLVTVLALTLGPDFNAEGAVTVYGSAVSEGEVITVELFADITDEPILSFAVRLTYDPGVVEAVSAWKDEAVWYLWDGAGFVPYRDPDLPVPGRVDLYGAKLDDANPLAGVIGNGIPLGGAVFRRLSDEDPGFGLAPGPGSGYAGFVGVEKTVYDSLPGGVVMGGVEPPPNDQDLDGLDDDWETDFLGDPSNYSYHDDPDGDGLTNQEEQALGTHPDDHASGLRLNLVWHAGELYAEWGSVEGKSYAVETSTTFNAYGPLQLGVGATPPMNSLQLDPIPNALGLRVYLESP